MRKIWPWLVGLVVFLVLGLFILLGVGYIQNRGFLPNATFPQQRFLPNDWHHHGINMRWGFPFVGMLGGLMFFLFVIGLLALIIFGIYLVVRPKGNKVNQIDESHSILCENCGKEVNPDWNICPYCGESLGEE